MEIIAWFLAVFGASNGVVASNLLEKFRLWLVNFNPFLGKLINCPMCLGFWFGGLAHFLAFSPTHSLLFDMFLGSCVSWVGFLLIYDEQYKLRVTGTCENCTKETLND